MSMSAPARPRIAVCYFGITRSLRHTLGSIEANILAPAQALGEVRRFAHLYPLVHLVNPRTGEATDLDPEEHRLLQADELILEEPGGCLERWRYDEIAAHGDRWKDDFKSLRNLVHQLHSLREVTLRALAWEPDIVVFCRPDLVYFDSFEPSLTRFVRRTHPLCGLPYWQKYGGYNDRFAIVRGVELARRYGTRIEEAIPYCEGLSRPLHAETLLHWALKGAPVRYQRLRAARIRADGRAHPYEPFMLDPIAALHRRVHHGRLPKRAKDGAHKALNLVQGAVDLALYGSARDPLRDWRAAR
ncbi:MAG: hypothetical protein ACXIU8_00835 [Alkalilacustris sp.]